MNVDGKKKRIKHYKLKGFAPMDDGSHQPISYSDQDDSLIPPKLVPVKNENGVLKYIPKYAETVRGVSTLYDPENNCQGYFMSAKFQCDNNCYNYSTNIATNSFAQPGRKNGMFLPSNWTEEDVKNGAVADGLVYIGDKAIDPRQLWQKNPAWCLL